MFDSDTILTFAFPEREYTPRDKRNVCPLCDTVEHWRTSCPLTGPRVDGDPADMPEWRDDGGEG